MTELTEKSSPDLVPATPDPLAFSISWRTKVLILLLGIFAAQSATVVILYFNIDGRLKAVEFAAELYRLQKITEHLEGKLRSERFDAANTEGSLDKLKERLRAEKDASNK